jgi:hypothetical protein
MKSRLIALICLVLAPPLVGCEDEVEHAPTLPPVEEPPPATASAKATPPKYKATKRDAKEVTTLTGQVVAALKAKQVKDLLPLMHRKVRDDMAKSFAVGGTRNTKYFTPTLWRWKAISASDGKPKAIRFSDKQARVKIGEGETEAYLLRMRLSSVQGWYFDAIMKRPKGDYDKWGKAIE